MKLSARLVALSFLTLGLSLTGCGSGELSRGEAESLISSEAEETRFEALDGAYETGKQAGLWSGSERAGIGINLTWTNEGKQYFSDAGVSRTFGGKNQVSRFELSEPAQNPVIEVTGIAEEGENERSAEFEWSYENLPSDVRQLVVYEGTGTAQFQRYDDGWRVSDIDH